MTIPNVTMRWCTKKSTCKWCDKPIEKETPLVKVFYWNKGNEESRKWNSKFYYHPQCWLDQGLNYLRMNPYATKYMGRRTVLNPEDRRKRFLLVRRFNAIVQKRANCNHSFPDHILTDIDLTQRMVDIMLEVATIGGVPKGWAEKL